MPKNPIEAPQTPEKNANKNTMEVRKESHAGRNHGNTKEEK